MQKFLEDSLEGRYIKSLLYNTYLPTYRTVRKNDFIIKGITYVYKESIIRADSSGYLDSNDLELLPKAKYTYLRDYIFGEFQPKFTSRFISRNNYYDTETHIRLGDYLRCYRDMRGIDLMPFYNCYSNKYTSSFEVSSSGIDIKTSQTAKYEVLEVPIKFNQVYTIAIDSPSTIIVAPALMSYDDLIVISSQNISERLWSIPGAIVTYPSTVFGEPITYKLENTDQFLQNYEKNLFLLIQIPNKLESSIVILEGDYTDTTRHIFDISGLQYLDEIEQDKYFLSNLSLLKLNDRIRYAYSDRLIEFLFGNVIDKNNDITNNVKRIQNYTKSNSYFNSMEDVWDDNLRKLIYDSYMDYAYNPYDITGYVDKDIEKFLRKV